MARNTAAVTMDRTTPHPASNSSSRDRFMVMLHLTRRAIMAAHSVRVCRHAAAPSRVQRSKENSYCIEAAPAVRMDDCTDKSLDCVIDLRDPGGGYAAGLA